MCSILVCIFRWKHIAQYFPRRSASSIRHRWRTICKLKIGTNVDKNTHKHIKERAAVLLLDLWPTCKLLLQKSSSTQKLSPKRSIPTESTGGKPCTKESNLYNDVMYNRDDIDVHSHNVINRTESPSIEFPFKWDLSEEAIDTFLPSFPTEEISRKSGTKESKLSNEGMYGDEALYTFTPKVINMTKSPPIEFSFTLDLSEEVIDAFINSTNPI